MATLFDTRTKERKETFRDFFGVETDEEITEESLERLLQFEDLMLKYRSAIREVTTKLEVLNDELTLSREHNPIASIHSRVKRPYSIAEKLRRNNQPVTVESIQEHLNDVAGIRVICSFINDIYDIAEMLLAQDDIRLITRKDYIKNPKPGGYRSLHLIVEIPVFFSTGKEPIRVEVQIRTVAMDFWASLEHKIAYKFEGDAPEALLRDLKSCADMVDMLDNKMYSLNKAILAIAEERRKDRDPAS